MNEFGVIGLGVMGRNISLNLLDKGFLISVYNRTENDENQLLESFIDQYNAIYKFDSFSEIENFVSSLERPRKILIMIKAGNAVDQLLTQLLPLLDDGDILIDGGNSHYLDTSRRSSELAIRNIQFIGCGISGGELGARFGPSIMPGGDLNSYRTISPYLESIAAKDDSKKPCCSYIGTDGAGHFVKMVHNGIEYAEMQLLAECYQLLRSSYSNEDIANEFERWISEGLSSYLLEITVEILRKKEGDKYILDLILDRAGNKGTGSWSSKSAFDLGSVNTMMSASVFARYVSSFKLERKKQSLKLKASRDIEPGATINLFRLFKFCSLINHHQGFELLRIASAQYGWDLKLDEVCRCWTNGCIIRSELMRKCHQYFKSASSILDVEEVFNFLEETQGEVQVGLVNGIRSFIPLPCVSSAYNYWLSITSENLPANLIQAQRDFFGAHTYERKDKVPGLFFHTNWQS